ncbi:MAG: restriction endonuclease, partial [Pyrobaculum sp.]
YLAGNAEALRLLKEAGFLNEDEPTSRGYVLYKALKHGYDVLSAVRYLGWDDFEYFLRLVFEEFGFSTAANLRLSCDRGAEFDIIAWKRDLAFVIEAKKWRSGWGRWGQVARDHLEKIRRCLPKLLLFAPSVVPLVVTSAQFSSIINGVPVVSVEKIRDFLTSFDHFQDQIVMFH